MIKINGYIVPKLNNYAGEIDVINSKQFYNNSNSDNVVIEWFWEEDNSEFFLLYLLVRHLKKLKGGNCLFSLYMPYVPYSFCDNEYDDFSGVIKTQKYFAEFINMLCFDFVNVIDPVSPILINLIDNIKVDKECVRRIIEQVLNKGNYDSIVIFDKNIINKNPILLMYRDKIVYAFNDSVSPKYTLITEKSDLGKTLIFMDVYKDDIDLEGLFAVLSHDKKCDLYITHCSRKIYTNEFIYKDKIENLFTTNSLMPTQPVTVAQEEGLPIINIAKLKFYSL